MADQEADRFGTKNEAVVKERIDLIVALREVKAKREACCGKIANALLGHLLLALSAQVPAFGPATVTDTVEFTFPFNPPLQAITLFKNDVLEIFGGCTVQVLYNREEEVAVVTVGTGKVGK